MTHPLIFDGHNDSLGTLYLPKKPRRDLLQESPSGHIDLPRAGRGGLGGGMFAIFVPGPIPDGEEPGDSHQQKVRLFKTYLSQPLDPAYAREMTEKGIRSLFELESGSGGKLRVVGDVTALRAALQEKVLAAVMHFEGAEVVDPGLERLEGYYTAGLRSLGLVWSRPNAFGTGVDFTSGNSPDQGPGLTAAGKALVQACNRLGILVDLSHLNEKGFWDVERITSAPLVATHSCAYALSPSPRNLTDAQLDAIGSSNGLVGINFAVEFVRADNGHDPETPLSDLVRHFTYLADRIGVEHVAFGSDFDGCTVPRELSDAAGLPRLMDALRQAGFSPEELQQIAHLNWLRVLDATWSAVKWTALPTWRTGY